MQFLLGLYSKPNRYEKPIKITLIVFGSLITLVALFIFINVGFCWKEYSKAYYEWLPYAKNDVVIFTDGKINWEFTVADAQKNHTSRYFKLCKCGYCEDNFMVTLISKTDEILISAMNYDNPDAYDEPLLTIMIGEEYNTAYYLFRENGKAMAEKGFTIEKSKGITRFNYSGKEWKLKEHIKKGVEPVVD